MRLLAKTGSLESDAEGVGGLLLIREWKPVRGIRVYLPLTDGLGSVCGLIDASDGSLAAEYDYDPYGNPVIGRGPALEACPFRHRTRNYDPETWLYYYGYRLHRCGAFFVTRAKQNARFKRRYSHQADKTAGVRFDQTVTLSGFTSHRHYPDPLRRIGCRDPATGKTFVVLTNNFLQPALTIARLYKSRWQVELFFK